MSLTPMSIRELLGSLPRRALHALLSDNYPKMLGPDGPYLLSNFDQSPHTHGVLRELFLDRVAKSAMTEYQLVTELNQINACLNYGAPSLGAGILRCNFGDPESSLVLTEFLSKMSVRRLILLSSHIKWKHQVSTTLASAVRRKIGDRLLLVRNFKAVANEFQFSLVGFENFWLMAFRYKSSLIVELASMYRQYIQPVVDKNPKLCIRFLSNESYLTRVCLLKKLTFPPEAKFLVNRSRAFLLSISANAASIDRHFELLPLVECHRLLARLHKQRMVTGELLERSRFLGCFVRFPDLVVTQSFLNDVLTVKKTKLGFLSYKSQHYFRLVFLYCNPNLEVSVETEEQLQSWKIVSDAVCCNSIIQLVSGPMRTKNWIFLNCDREGAVVLDGCRGTVRVLSNMRQSRPLMHVCMAAGKDPSTLNLVIDEIYHQLVHAKMTRDAGAVHNCLVALEYCTLRVVEGSVEKFMRSKLSVLGWCYRYYGRPLSIRFSHASVAELLELLREDVYHGSVSVHDLEAGCAELNKKEVEENMEVLAESLLKSPITLQLDQRKHVEDLQRRIEASYLREVRNLVQTECLVKTVCEYAPFDARVNAATVTWIWDLD